MKGSPKLTSPRILIFLFLSAFGLQACPPKTSFTAKVIGIKDGDTVEVLRDGKPLVIRLSGIDCPKKGQPYGNAAKQFASDFCYGKMAQITGDGKYDRNKRLLADVEIDGSSLCKALVRNGYAWHFKRYSNDVELDQLERKARSAKIGLWVDKNPIAPWDWRKGKR